MNYYFNHPPAFQPVPRSPFPERFLEFQGKWIARRKSRLVPVREIEIGIALVIGRCQKTFSKIRPNLSKLVLNLRAFLFENFEELPPSIRAGEIPAFPSKGNLPLRIVSLRIQNGVLLSRALRHLHTDSRPL